jgi:hypothetical protein
MLADLLAVTALGLMMFSPMALFIFLHRGTLLCRNKH